MENNRARKWALILALGLTVAPLGGGAAWANPFQGGIPGQYAPGSYQPSHPNSRNPYAGPAHSPILPKHPTVERMPPTATNSPSVSSSNVPQTVHRPSSPSTGDFIRGQLFQQGVQSFGYHAMQYPMNPNGYGPMYGNSISFPAISSLPAYQVLGSSPLRTREKKTTNSDQQDHPHTVSRPVTTPPAAPPTEVSPNDAVPQETPPDYNEEDEKKYRQWLRDYAQAKEEESAEHIRPFPVSVFPAVPTTSSSSTTSKPTGTIPSMKDDLAQTKAKIAQLENQRANSLLPGFLWDFSESARELRLLKGYAQGIEYQLEVFEDAEARGKDGIQAINQWTRERGEMFVNAMSEHLQIMGGAINNIYSIRQLAQQFEETLRGLDAGRQRALMDQRIQQAKAAQTKASAAPEDFMPGGKLRPANAPTIESSAAARGVRPDSPVKGMAQGPSAGSSTPEPTPSVSKNVTKLKNMYSPPGLKVDPNDKDYAQKFFDAGGVRPKGWQIDHTTGKGVAKAANSTITRDGARNPEPTLTGLKAIPGERNNAYSPFDAHQAKKTEQVVWKGGDPKAIVDVNTKMHTKAPPVVQPMDPKTARLLKQAADTGAEGYKGAPPRPINYSEK